MGKKLKKYIETIEKRADLSTVERFNNIRRVALILLGGFLALETGNVAAGWRTSVIVASLFVWSIPLRYIVGLLKTTDTDFLYRVESIFDSIFNIEFYLQLAAIGKANSGMFWKLLIASIIQMLADEFYLNGNNTRFKYPYLAVTSLSNFYILYEIFSGETGRAAARSGNKALVTSFGANRMLTVFNMVTRIVFTLFLNDRKNPTFVAIYNWIRATFLGLNSLVVWAAATSSSGKRAK